MPMQTASVVPGGSVRLGGEVAVTPWCSLSVNPIGNCLHQPTSFAVPEGRFDARVGLGDGMDLGGSLRGTGLVQRGYQLGLLLDWKKELWAREIAPGRRQIVSVGPGAGADLVVVESSPSAQLQAVLPVWLGHETERFEWVVSPRFVERFIRVGASWINSEEFGLALGMYSRGAPRWGLQLAYHAPFVFPASGPFTVSAGVLFDVGAPVR